MFNLSELETESKQKRKNEIRKKGVTNCENVETDKNGKILSAVYFFNYKLFTLSIIFYRN